MEDPNWDINACEVDENFSTDYQCYLIYLHVFLRQIRLHFITLGLLALIIVISIFGKIKANFRWFILNQAIWDAFITYDFYCNSNYDNTKCFYRIYLNYPVWKIALYTALNNIFRMNSYPAFFLLAFSRFLCLYFNDFYEKITKKFRIFFLILVFSLVCVSITGLLVTFQNIANTRYTDLKTACKTSNTDLYDTLTKYCATVNTDFVYNFYLKAYQIVDKIDRAKGIACMIGAIIPSFFIVRKVSSQFKFQYNNNRKDFYASLRIAMVLMLQLLFNSFILFFETLQSIYDITTITSYQLKDYSFITILKGLSSFTNIQTFRQIRVFLECVVILAIMTGYREAVFKLIKWASRGFKNKKITPNVSAARTSSGIIFVNER